ncbi:MAG: polymer-forming cytoskeletal protein [Oscillibacter sp.]
MKEIEKNETEKRQNSAGNNAKTAFKELAAMAGLTKTPPEERISDEPAGKVVPFDLSKAAPAPEKVERPMEVSLIAADVVVEGTTRTTGALDCRGVVKGDLIAKGAITMSGKQVGNIQGQQIHFSNASIEGNVTAQEYIEITHGTKIIGDIRGGSVLLNGQVTGLICAVGLVSLRKNAVLLGDIQAGAISIEEGAQISGQIKMKLAEVDRPEPARVAHL